MKPGAKNIKSKRKNMIIDISDGSKVSGWNTPQRYRCPVWEKNETVWQERVRGNVKQSQVWGGSSGLGTWACTLTSGCGASVVWCQRSPHSFWGLRILFWPHRDKCPRLWATVENYHYETDPVVIAKQECLSKPRWSFNLEGFLRWRKVSHSFLLV